ncbi:BMP family ABC transporter substrate-binding protein [Nocardioides sp. Bht2]|uniref:BMP family ABC transporter substrate-binding protein n=1 Tax=Nocardioides sp. Bht2 TaxID=3392297 RepID=UPI0039B57DE7
MNLRATLGGLAALVTVAAGATACSSGESSATADDGRLKVAVVLGGLANDGGFNQYAADALNALEKEGLLDAQIRESVVNPADAEPIFRQFAAEKYDLVIGWGLGFSDSVFKVAEELPETHFVATGSSDILERSTANVETWSYAFDEVGYLTGWVAGKSQLSPVAVVDGELAPFNELSYRYLSVGLKAANPSARELKPVFTGSWEDPKLAHQATKAQIAAGAKLVVTGAEGFTSGVLAAAEDGGIATFGASDGSSQNAAKVNIGLVKLDFTPTLRLIVDRLDDDTFGKTSYESTIANRGLILADFHAVQAAPELPADIEGQVEKLAADLADGTVTIPEVR